MRGLATRTIGKAGPWCVGFVAEHRLQSIIAARTLLGKQRVSLAQARTPASHCLGTMSQAVR